jgi:hypothetical protein
VAAFQDLYQFGTEHDGFRLNSAPVPGSRTMALWPIATLYPRSGNCQLGNFPKRAGDLASAAV